MSFGGMGEILGALKGTGGAAAAAKAGSAAAGTGALAAKAASAGGAAALKAKALAPHALKNLASQGKILQAKALSSSFTGGLAGQKALGIGALKGFNPAKVGLGRSGSQVFNQKMNNLVSQNIGNTANVLKPSNFGQSMQQGLKLNQGGGLGAILKDPKRTKALMASLETVKGIFDSMEERRRRR